MVTRPEARHCQPSLGSAARSHNLLGGQAPAYVPGLAHKDTSELHGVDGSSAMVAFSAPLHVTSRHISCPGSLECGQGIR